MLVERLQYLVADEPDLGQFLVEYVNLADVFTNYAANTGVRLAETPEPTLLHRRAKTKFRDVNNTLRRLTTEMQEATGLDRPMRTSSQPARFRHETTVSTSPRRGPRVRANDQQIRILSDLATTRYRSVAAFYEEHGIDPRTLTYNDGLEWIERLRAT